MKAILHIYRLLNYLSLDVACGAVVCATFFARILNVQLRPPGLASLGLTVWIIYTADHLLDAYRLKHEASSQRHRFHQRNFRMLLVIMLVAILVDLLLILFVRQPILNWGIGLSLIVVLYLALQQNLRAFKELVVALLYVAGVLLPAMSLTTVVLSAQEITLIAFFASTAFINLVLFSWYDWMRDLTDNHFSLVTFFGRSLTKKILVLLFSLQLTLTISLLVNSTYQTEAAILFVMNLPLLILFLFPEKFQGENGYRLIGDIVFLFPLVYFF